MSSSTNIASLMRCAALRLCSSTPLRRRRLHAAVFNSGRANSDVALSSPYSYYRSRWMIRSVMTISNTSGVKRKPHDLQDLLEVCRMMSLPQPTFTFSVSGFKKPLHTCELRLSLPTSLSSEFGYKTLVGRGRGRKKQDAKLFAAMSASMNFEESMGQSLMCFARELEEQHHEKQQKVDTNPCLSFSGDEEWMTLPLDDAYSERRRNCINFQDLRRVPDIDGVGGNKADVAGDGLAKRAMDGARLATLRSHSLPQLSYHNNLSKEGVKMHANLTLRLGRKKRKRVLIAHAEKPFTGDFREKIAIQAQVCASVAKATQPDTMAHEFVQSTPTMGMAILYPEIQCSQLRYLTGALGKLEQSLKVKAATESKQPQTLRPTRRRRRSLDRNHFSRRPNEVAQAAFKRSQKRYPLPIDNVEDELKSLLRDNDVVVLSSSTGSGKTTRLPAFLQFDSSSSHPTHRIAVSEPRRVAAQTAAARMAAEQQTSLGDAGCGVGYAIRFERRTPKCDVGGTVEFFTTGVLLREAMNVQCNKSGEAPPVTMMPFHRFSHIVIDEAHERDSQTDLLLAMVRDAIKKRRHTENPLKVVVMSATLHSEKFVDYFSCNEDSIRVQTCNVESEKRFDVTELFLEDLNDNKTSNIRVAPPLQRNLLHAETGAALCRETQFEYDELLAETMSEVIRDLCSTASSSLTLSSNEDDSAGACILCFLPGWDEIRRVENLVKTWSQNDRENRGKPSPLYRRIHISTLHSQVPQHQQKRAFLKVPRGEVKLILATNLAESSVTIPDVTVVIDSGREKQHRVPDASEAAAVYSSLDVVPISKASATQRAGRAGRVAPGTCVRLYSKKRWQVMFPTQTQPEIQRMHLQDLLLLCKNMPSDYYSSAQEWLLETLDPPSKQRIHHTIRKLIEMDIIEGESNDDDGIIGRQLQQQSVKEGELTALGKFVSSLPIDVNLGRMIALGCVLGGLGTAITMASVLSVPEAFKMNGHSRQGIGVRHANTTSDVFEVMRWFEQWKTPRVSRVKQHGHNRKSRGGNEKSHGTSRLSERTARQIERIHRQISMLLKEKGFDIEQRSANDKRLGIHVALACYGMQHVAHLIGSHEFATRDLCGAYLHPGSVNFRGSSATSSSMSTESASWFLYQKVVKTSKPFMSVTTAVSPIDIALFAGTCKESTDLTGADDDAAHALLIDDWIPVRGRAVSSCGTGRDRYASCVFEIARSRAMLTQLMHDVMENPCQTVSEEMKNFSAILISIMELERHRQT